MVLGCLELPQIEPFHFNANGVNGGQAVRVMCMVTSGDLPLDIYWLKDGQPLLRSIYHKIDEYTLILALRHTHITDSGNYSCVARNTAGEAHKWSLLRVKGIFLHYSTFFFQYQTFYQFKVKSYFVILLQNQKYLQKFPIKPLHRIITIIWGKV